MEDFGLPMSFGKKAKGPSAKARTKTVQANVAQTKREPVVPKEEAPKEESDEEIGPMPPSAKRKADDDSDSDAELEEEEDRTPVTHEIVLKDHTKLWDFGGMDARLRPFKSFEPNGSYFVRDLSYSPDGKHLLAISGTFYPKVFSRDGDDQKEFMKGDVYIRDMKTTKGHTAEINAGQWHPHDRDLFLTASNDSTLRIWDVNDRSKQKQVIVVRSKERGNKTHVTSCCLDGTIHVWKTASNLARPDRSSETAHEKGQEITGVAFSPDGKKLVSRSMDETVKCKLKRRYGELTPVWDPRSPRKPLAVATGIACRYSETNVSFSPDGKYVLVGTAIDPRDETAVGEVLFLSSEDLKVVRRVPIAKASVIKVLWHSRINQLFCTLSNGQVYVLYSPQASIHGALLPLAKMPRSGPRDLSFTTADLTPVVFTPDAHGGIQNAYGQSLHQQQKAAKRFKPTEPVSGVGRGGRVGASATAGFVQDVFKRRLEPTEDALLKYASEEEKKKLQAAREKQEQN
ncbi:transcription factor [Trichosporon asahii var. asahii CBS 8904]|uniref:Transcription factor n=1 Tax=Trichosporon asahii var. asahii (strain CBS 8904) TaxID=1220162 RepID=K1V123_TRIAC|nr:transcription factor [Trichosporon asahii var. asahii CBS 8904]